MQRPWHHTTLPCARSRGLGAWPAQEELAVKPSPRPQGWSQRKGDLASIIWLFLLPNWDMFMTRNHWGSWEKLGVGLDGRWVWGRMGTCTWMAKSLCYSSETITTLLISYTPIYSWRKSGQKRHELRVFSRKGLLLPAAAAAVAKSRQLCPTLCDPTDGSPPGSSVHANVQRG